MTITELVAKAFENSKAHGFHDDEDPVQSVPEKLCLIHSEISEALEHYREGNGGHKLNTIFEQVDHPSYGREPSKPDGLAVELADAVIRIADLCGALQINLDKAIEMKMAYNATRPHKHGKVC